MPYGTDVGWVLQELDAIGIFAYVMPFLLIFAIVYAILSEIKVFKDNKAVPLIIAVAIGLLSLYNGRVPAFFATIFPQLGIGIALLMTAVLLFGIFVPLERNAWGNYIFMGLGMLFFIIIALSSFTEYTFWTSWWWQRYWSAIVVLIIVVAVVVLIVSFNKNSSGP